MWFNNIQIFHYEFRKAIDLPSLLAEAALKPCPPHARFIYGWLPVFNQQFTHELSGASICCMGKEERLLPKGVIQKLLQERLDIQATSEHRQLSRTQKKQMAEELEFELLPKAFCLQKRTFALLDEQHHRLIVNSSSPTQAATLTALLRKTCPDLQLTPLLITTNLAKQLASWIADPAALPKQFQLASDCAMFCLDDHNKKVQCKGYELPSEEVLTLLSQNLAIKEVSLIWQDRIQFTLTKDLILKRVTCLDYLQDAFQETNSLEPLEQQDAALALLVGELRNLLNDLLTIFPQTDELNDRDKACHAAANFVE